MNNINLAELNGWQVSGFIKSLISREYEILILIAAGKLNKKVAYDPHYELKYAKNTSGLHHAYNDGRIFSRLG